MGILDVLHDIAPQFTDDAKNLRFIGYASPLMDSGKFAGSYELAVAYLTAHLLTVASRPSGIAGFLNNIEEGDRTLGYATVNPSDSDLMTTSYGVEFKRLMNMYITPVMVTGGGVLGSRSER